MGDKSKNDEYRKAYIKGMIRKYGKNWREHIRPESGTMGSITRPPFEKRQRPQKKGEYKGGGSVRLAKKGGGRAYGKNS